MKDRIVARARITKIDDEKRLVFGWANVAVYASGEQVEDSHGDLIDPDDLEAAAYAFCLHFRELNTNHIGKTRGVLVESFMVTPHKLQAIGLTSDGSLGVESGWWVGFYISDDDAWEGVKKGEYSMFSIEGWAVREDA